MDRLFNRDRFGGPQAIAALLLAIFSAQCAWLVYLELHPPQPDMAQEQRIQEGLRQWHGEAIAGSLPSVVIPSVEPRGDESIPPHAEADLNHSPLWYLIASAPLLAWRQPLQADTKPIWGWLAHAPYLAFGWLLGASLWYVARRLYGDTGGYIALMLYCFAPGMIRSAAVWNAQPEVGAVWGAFGAIFTAIAVSHTLYAPREVVLWNWRRILLLALSLVLAVGSQFSLAMTLPIALGFMLFLAPMRRGAAVAIWAAATGAATLLLFSSFAFRPAEMWRSLAHARFFALEWSAFAMPGAYRQAGENLGQICPALLMAFPAALAAYIVWPRTRYFGNSAPLLVAVAFLLFAVGSPHYPGLGFTLVAVPFLFVFISGVLADLLETRQRLLVMAGLWGLLGASAFWNLMQLATLPRG